MPTQGRTAENHLLDDLTPAQREAVTHGEGPLLILAGAGSGKTRVITRRVAWLLEQGVKPWNILAITFTNKAAGEMRDRVEALAPGNRVWISTFHSFGARLLRQHGERLGLDRNFTIYDQTDRLRVIKSALELAGLDDTRYRPSTIAHAISRAKNELLSPARFGPTAKDFFQMSVAHVYPAYEKKLRDANALDFDDLLYWVALGLKNDAEWRAEMDARFSHILIDEYQDTNKAQYAIVRALSMDQQNLCVVGDPDQSIYKFRNADIRNILDFEKDFPNARTITLERNYRSTKSILKAASQVIAHNVHRKPKELNTENPEGRPVSVLQFDSSLDEADGVTRQIKAAVERGERKYRDFALFVRINALTRVFESSFVRNNIPYQIVRGFAFYDRKENKDVLAYLRLLLNPQDDVAFLRIVNEPARGVGKTSLQRLQEYAEPREISLLSAARQVRSIEAIRGRAVKGLEQFTRIVDDLTNYVDDEPDELLCLVIDKTGYRNMLLSSGNEEDAQRLANIEEMITAAKQFVEEDESRTIADFLENITLASDVDGWDDEQNCVSVMTLHASKGLEFPVVYMVAVEQGILPHERSVEKKEEGEIEEERRLAFVGMTRAKEELKLTHCRLREFRGQTLYANPSVFLRELPDDGVDRSDVSTSAAGRAKVHDAWRGGNAAANPGWIDAGVFLENVSAANNKTGKSASPKKEPEEAVAYRIGMLVQHEKYGKGRITNFGGTGAMQKVKVRFRSGERTFIAKMAKLEVIES